jgi:CheY-like chemotaxis protein
MLPSAQDVAVDYKVGVLEDDYNTIESIREGLKRFGFVVVGATSKDEAVALARDSGIRRFVLDIQVRSSTDGLEALEEVKELDPTTQAYVYSRHVGVGGELYTNRANRLKADLVIEKVNPQLDVLRIARQLLLHQKRLLTQDIRRLETGKYLNAQRLEEVEIMLAQRVGQQTPPDAGVKATNKLSTELTKEPFKAPFGEDPNIALYQRLVSDPAWFGANVGQFVGIVDGSVIFKDVDAARVLAELRNNYPSRPRFMKRVEVEEDVVEIPTPFDIDD